MTIHVTNTTFSFFSYLHVYTGRSIFFLPMKFMTIWLVHIQFFKTIHEINCSHPSTTIHINTHIHAHTGTIQKSSVFQWVWYLSIDILFYFYFTDFLAFHIIVVYWFQHMKTHKNSEAFNDRKVPFRGTLTDLAFLSFS